MMEQPEALRLAEWAESYPESFYDSYFGDVAAELRRQHAEIERKSEAIQKLWKERDEAIAEIERLRADAALVRDQALEEAAITGGDAADFSHSGHYVASAIRALKASPDAEVK